MNKGGNFMRDPRAADNPNTNAAPVKQTKEAKAKVIRRLLGYTVKHWYLVLAAMVLTVLSNLLALIGPDCLGNAIDAIALLNTEGADNAALLLTVRDNVVKMLLCYIAAAFLAYLMTFVMVTLSQRITYLMRKQLFDSLTSLPVSYFDTHATGDIISRISYDIDTVNASLSTDIVQVLTSIFTVVGSLYFMIRISRPMMLVFLITIPISVIFTRYKSKKIRPLFRKRSAMLGELNGYAEEMLSGAKTIRAYRREATIVSRFDRRNRAAVDAHYDADYYGAMIGPSVNFINNLSLSLVMIFGGILFYLSTTGSVADTGGIFSLYMTMGNVTKFVMYSRKFAGPINEFANIVSEFQSAFAAAERVFRIIDEVPEKPDAPDAARLEEVSGEVTIDGVRFGYTKEKEIIHDLSLKVKPGQTVAIVGPTGAGKTTLINLLMRFYDVDDGRISLDGHDIREVTRDSLRGSYTMVLQDTWLFYGTIAENISYGRADASREEVIAAAKAAKIDSFIEHLPDGYDTLLSDDGVNISKGQKQLITIARAMLPKTPMLILDEATSNVDSRTEINIREAMAHLMENHTCFVIAHRLSTIKNADLILVVKDGNIIEQGTHGDLLRAGGFYASLYNSQFD